MAHFSKIDENNNVVGVYVVHDNEAPNEATGITFCQNTIGPGTYLQTSYNTEANQHTLGGTPFRGNYGGLSAKWLPDESVFQPPQEFPSWTWDSSNAKWIAPIARPTQDANPGTFWDWDEDVYNADTANPKTQGWVEIFIADD